MPNRPSKKTVVRATKSVVKRKLTGDKAITGKAGKKSFKKEQATVGKDGKGGSASYVRSKKRKRKTLGGGTRTVEKGTLYTPQGSTKYKTVIRTKKAKSNKKRKSPTVHKTVRYL